MLTMEAGTKFSPVKTRGLRYPIASDPFRALQHRVNRLFEDFGIFSSVPPFIEEGLAFATWTPACDIYENEHEIVIKVELPEVKKEALQVTVQNNLLTIRGERKLETETNKEDFHRVERNYGEFLRSFTLPAIIDPTRINAEFKEGLLRVVLPKREEVKAKEIEVKVK